MATVAELIDAQHRRAGTGLLAGDRRLTHREVAAAAAARAALITARHTPGREPHVGVLLPNTPEFAAWLGGAALAGAAVVGVNPTRRGAELAGDIRHAECEFLVTAEEFRPLLAGLDLGGLPVLAVDGPGYAEELAPHLDRVPADIRPVAPITEATRYLLYFTSGSTGAPKAVTCTQGRLAASGQVMADRFDLTPADVCYIPMPMFHGNAILADWGPALVAGAAVALRDRFSASGFLPDVRRYGATYFTYVGRAISYLLATPERPDDHRNTLRAGFGTEAGPVDRDRFEQRFGCHLSEGYGASEGGINIVAPRDFPAAVLARGTAVGRADPTLHILDLDTGGECPRAEFDDRGRLLNGAAAIGELVKTGTGLFTGYWKNPEADAERLTGGRYHSGDLFYRDADDWLYFAARTADKMRVDGENISVALLEAILTRHPDIAAAAAYAVPDPVTGDAVMCALVPRAPLTPAGLTAFLAAQPDLGTKMTPRFVRLTDELTVTATTKISRYTLRAQGWWRPGGDPVWHRDPATGDYLDFDTAAETALRQRFAEHGRTVEP